MVEKNKKLDKMDILILQEFQVKIIEGRWS